MTQTDKLRALADALGQVPEDTPDAAYFGLDMTHGQARRNLAAILTMAEDAARYHWLRDHSCPPHNFYISVPDEFSGVRYGPSEVDDYIDAARQALAAPGDGG